jgi:hypothetical protein
LSELGTALNRFLKNVTRLSQMYDFSMHSYAHVVSDLKSQLERGEISAQSHINSTHGFMLHHRVASTLDFVKGSFPKQLRSVVLIRLVSLFEVFLIDQIVESARTAKTYFRKDAKFEWTRERLFSFVSMDELMDHMRTADARTLSSGGFDEIRKYYQKHLKFDICPPGVKIDEIREAHARRHLYVHNDGLIDHEYCKAFNQSARTGTQIGVSDEYLKSVVLLFKRVAHYVSVTARGRFITQRNRVIPGSTSLLNGKILYFFRCRFLDAATQTTYLSVTRKIADGNTTFGDVFVGGHESCGLVEWTILVSPGEMKEFAKELRQLELRGGVEILERKRLTPKQKANNPIDRSGGLAAS